MKPTDLRVLHRLELGDLVDLPWRQVADLDFGEPQDVLTRERLVLIAAAGGGIEMGVARLDGSTAWRVTGKDASSPGCRVLFWLDEEATSLDQFEELYRRGLATMQH